MYKKYWNLTKRPFELGPDTSFHYPAAETQATLQKIRYLLETRRGSLLLTGQTGVGKTHLTKTLVEGGASKRFDPVFNVSAAIFDAENFLFYLAVKAAETCPAAADAEEIDQFDTTDDERPDPLYRAFLTLERTLNAAAEARKRPLLIVEDADRVRDPRLWSLLKGLIDLPSRTPPSLSILLIGESEPADSGFARFEPYLETSAVLRPLHGEETVDYVLSRLALAGTTAEIFTREALETVYRLTDGIPRRINRLCDMALLIGYAEKLAKIDDATLEALQHEVGVF